MHAAASELRLNGDRRLAAGQGERSTFDLDIAARNFPIADIAEFLDLGTLPVTGELTGTLHLEGTEGEPRRRGRGHGAQRRRSTASRSTSATADIAFTQGTMKVDATSPSTAPAGTITGEARARTSTRISSPTRSTRRRSISRSCKLLASLAGSPRRQGHADVERRRHVRPAGAGARSDAQPGDDERARAARRTRRRRSSTSRSATAGSSCAAPSPDVHDDRRRRHRRRRTARSTVSCTSRSPTSRSSPAISPNTASLPASGNFTIDLQLGGKLSPIEALRIDATFPASTSSSPSTSSRRARPLHFVLRDGRIVFDDFDAAAQPASTLRRQRLRGAHRREAAQHRCARRRSKRRCCSSSSPTCAPTATSSSPAAFTARSTDPRSPAPPRCRTRRSAFAGFPQMHRQHHRHARLPRRPHRHRLAARDGSAAATIVAGGSIGVERTDAEAASRITLQGTDVAIRYFEGLTVEGNFNAAAQRRHRSDRSLTGDVNVKRALYFKDIDFGTALLNVVLSRRGVTPIVAATWQDHVSLRLHLIAPDTLAVRNNIADVTGSADLDVSGTLANPVILGVVTLNEGGKIKLPEHRLPASCAARSISRIRSASIRTSTSRSKARVSGGILRNRVGTDRRDGQAHRHARSHHADDHQRSARQRHHALLAPRLRRADATRDTGTQRRAGRGDRCSFLSLSRRLLGSQVLPFADTFTYRPRQLDNDRRSRAEGHVREDASRTTCASSSSTTRATRRNRVARRVAGHSRLELQFTRDQSRTSTASRRVSAAATKGTGRWAAGTASR